MSIVKRNISNNISFELKCEYVFEVKYFFCFCAIPASLRSPDILHAVNLGHDQRGITVQDSLDL